MCARCACCAAVLRAGVRTQPRAEVLGGKLLGSVAQHGTYCGVRGTRSVGGSQGDWATGAGYEGAVRAAGAISAAPRLRGGSGGRGSAQPHPREGAKEEVVLLASHSLIDDPEATLRLGIPSVVSARCTPLVPSGATDQLDPGVAAAPLAPVGVIQEP